MAWTTAGVSWAAGWDPADVTCTRPAALMVEQGSGHLGAARVMGADEQHLGDVGHYHFLMLCSARELGGLFSRRTVLGRVVASAKTVPIAPPRSWAAINAGAEAAAIPASMPVRVRPMVTAGLANEVEAVNQ